MSRHYKHLSCPNVALDQLQTLSAPIYRDHWLVVCTQLCLYNPDLPSGSGQHFHLLKLIEKQGPRSVGINIWAQTRLINMTGENK